MERLLIVEDEKMIRKGLQVIAQRAPVEIREILECKNGEEALEILKSTKVDVMFTDVRMPKPVYADQSGHYRRRDQRHPGCV